MNPTEANAFTVFVTGSALFAHTFAVISIFPR
jgi:hypothetical protein